MQSQCQNRVFMGGDTPSLELTLLPINIVPTSLSFPQFWQKNFSRNKIGERSRR